MFLPGPYGWYIDRDSATLAIAVLALLLPGLRWGYDKYFRRGTIAFYKIGKIGVNFAWQGSIVALNGTYRAMNEPLFVEAIRLSLVRQQDSSKHSLDWYSVRFPTYGPSGVNWNFGTAGSFLITPSQPQRYDLLFLDPVAEKEFEPLKGELQDKWTAHVEKAYEDAQAPALAAGLAEENPPNPAEYVPPVVRSPQTLDEEEVFMDFFESDDIRLIRTEIDRDCYWEAGRYSLTMDILTADPTKTFSNKWAFELSADDARGLRNNTEAIVRSWCQVQLPFGTEYVARVDYQQPA